MHVKPTDKIIFPFPLPNNTLLETNKAAKKKAHARRNTKLSKTLWRESGMYAKHIYCESKCEVKNEGVSSDKVVDAAGLST